MKSFEKVPKILTKIEFWTMQIQVILSMLHSQDKRYADNLVQNTVQSDCPWQHDDVPMVNDKV